MNIKIQDKYNGEMYQPLQKIVCINNQYITFRDVDLILTESEYSEIKDSDGIESHSYWNDQAHLVLKLYKVYTVESVISFCNRTVVRIYLSEQEYDSVYKSNWFFIERFMSISKYRKNKLQQLNNSLKEKLQCFDEIEPLPFIK